MNSAELRALYEKLYFHEVDARDRIHSRLQIPLTLVVAIIGASAFLLQNFDYEMRPWTPARTMFAFFFVASTVSLVTAIVWFVKALYKNEYYFLPDAARTAGYKLELEKTYQGYEGANALIDTGLQRFVEDAFVQYGSFNTRVNDRRSGFIHLCNGAIIATAILLFVAFLFFYFGGLDRSRVGKPTEITVVKPVDVRLQQPQR